MYTLDTNAIIYLVAGEGGVVEYNANILEHDRPLLLPTVCEAEFFPYRKLTATEVRDFERVVSFMQIVPLDSQIARLAGVLRGTYHVPLIDSVVAATSLVTRSTVLTRNVADFKSIPELKVRRI